MIVATAGHVDHGKTELIKALTGIDTDRLPEEKARGLTLDLGFAYKTMRNGEILAFVDVPGHEKFIRNMLAGVAGIDLGLLVVAADDGIMRQTREHYSILEMLGIGQIMVALTKVDRVSPDRISEVNMQVRSLFKKDGQVSVFPVCAPKNIGIGKLKAALNQRAKAIKPKSTDGYFRMAIDRAFGLKGVGLVVTGTVFSGKLCTSENLTLLSDGSTVRVREIRVYNQIRNEVKAGERCALNIVGRGVSERSIKRGAWLADSSLNAPTRRIDVNLQVLETETSSLKHWTPTHLHIGADHLPARVAVLRGGHITAGSTNLAQLVLPRDIFVVHGDRFVLRDTSAQRTIAGGSVIDPFSPKRGRARTIRMDILDSMNGKTTADILLSLAKTSKIGVSLKLFSVSHNLPIPQITALAASLGLRLVGNLPTKRIFSEIQWQRLLNNILVCLASFHKLKPSLFGASVKDLQIFLKISIDADTLETALKFMVSKRILGARGNRFHLHSHDVYVSEQDRSILALAQTLLAPDFGSPPSLYEVAKEIGVEVKLLEKSLKMGVKLGEIVILEKNRYVPSRLIIKLKDRAKKLASTSADGLLTTAKYRDEVNMGRNFVISVLEYFDRVRFTERVGDHRRVRGSVPSQ